MILINLIDYLFPSYCINCGGTISINDICVCKSCLEKITFVKNECPICSGIIDEGSCSICSHRMWYIDKSITIAEYSGVMKEIIHQYKFNEKRRLHKLLGELVYRAIKSSGVKFDFVTAIPMCRAKQWKRGYNQSILLAKELSRKLNIRYMSVLTERAGSGTQRELHSRGRFLNVFERYRVINNQPIRNKSVLLVDDVFTTGATINECARLLKEGGARSVYSLTAARASLSGLLPNTDKSSEIA